MFRAARHRNYRLFFVGHGTSMVGTWLTRVATSWLVYRLTGSAVLLGVVGFAGQLPTFLLAPLAGVLVDRWNRHRLLLAVQAASMVQSALLAWFAFRQEITVTHVLVLSVLQGLLNAFDTPARQAMLVEMVPAREDLANAIALNSSLVNLARMVGPSLAGLLLSRVGEGWCFALDAVSYLAVLGSLLAMRLAPREPRPQRSHVLRDLQEGFAYVRDFVPIRALLLLLASVSLLGVPYVVLMPVFAREVLHGGPNTLGLLMAASGVGALAGALYLASRRSVIGLERVLWVAGLAFGLGLIAFAQSRTLWLSVPLMGVVGAGMMVQLAACNTLVQTLVDDDKRGRVMSFFTMGFFGMVPFGSLAAGVLGDRVGAPATVTLAGLATVVATVLFLLRLPELRRLARPAYVKLGIVTE